MSEGSLLVVIGAAAVLAFGTYKVVHKMDDAALARVNAAVAEANVQAQKQSADLLAAQARLSQQTGGAEAVAQNTIAARTNTIIQKVPTYVTVTQDRACVPYGLVRVLDASALGLDPADLVPPPGQSDDACAPVATSDLARSVAGNYGTARQNAEQLNALEADVKARQAMVDQVTTQTKAPPPAKKTGLLGRLFHKKN